MIVKTVILGLDGLDYDLVTKWNLKNLQQDVCSTIGVPIHKEAGVPSSPEVWASFLTGENIQGLEFARQGKVGRILNLLIRLRKHFNFGFGVGRVLDRMTPVRTFPELRRTTFIDRSDVSEINAPFYSYDPIVLTIIELFGRGELSLQQAITKIFENYKKQKQLIIRELNNSLRNANVVFAYLHFPDAVQHLLFTRPRLIKEHYFELDNYVLQLKSVLNNDSTTFFIVSDHGFNIERGTHSLRGFFSSNNSHEVGHPEHITEVFRKLFEIHPSANTTNTDNLGGMLARITKQVTGLTRKICSYAPSLCIVPKTDTTDRKPGISALVILRNEPFVEPSLLSIKDFVDEFVVADCSTDDTPIKVKRIAREHNLNLKYTHMQPNITQQLETVFKSSSHEWLLIWAGDFIGFTSGDRSIHQLKNVIEQCSQDKYYFIEFPVLNMELDLLHTTRRPYHLEAYLFRYSPLLMEMPILRWMREFIRIYVNKRLPRRYPFTPYPLWYDRIILRQAFVMHLKSVKSPLRVLERRYDIIWAILSHDIQRKFSLSFENYFRYCIKRDFGKDITKEREEVVNTYIKRLMEARGLIPYNTKKYGDYPAVLKNMIKDKLGMDITSSQRFREKIMAFLVDNN